MRALLGVVALLLAAIVVPPAVYALLPREGPGLPPPGRRVTVRPDLSVNLLEVGAAAGAPVVLVHGHPGCAYDWQATARELVARGFHVFAYDRLGYGHSDGRPPGRITVEMNAADLLALLAALDLRDATVVGWSYGGATSLVAARRDVSRIGRLVLVGSVGPGMARHRRELPEPVMDFLAGPVLSWIAAVPPVARRVRGAMVAQAFAPEPVAPGYRALVDGNFAAPHTLATFRSEGRDLGGEADLDPAPLTLPVLVVHGDGDELVPLAVGETLHQRARGSEMLVVPGAGHMIPVTHAALLADAVARFVVEPGAAP